MLRHQNWHMHINSMVTDKCLLDENELNQEWLNYKIYLR
jgi:hypothetical protein